MSFLPPKVPASFIQAQPQPTASVPGGGGGGGSEEARKRKRTSSVCTNCRRRKIRCDRESPCSNCVKTKRQASCVYDDGMAHVSTSGPRSLGIHSIPEGATTSTSRNGNGNGYLESVRTPIRFDTDRGSGDGSGPRKKSKSSVSSNVSGIGSGSMGDDQITISMTELNMLKQRLENIESSINGKTTPIPLATAPPPSNTTTTTTTTNGTNGGAGSILPPPVSFTGLSSPGKPEPLMFPPPRATPPPASQPHGITSGNRFQTTYNVSNARATPTSSSLSSSSSPAIQLPPITLRDQETRNNSSTTSVPTSYGSVGAASLTSSSSSDSYFKTPGTSISAISPNGNISNVRNAGSAGGENSNLIGVNPYLDETETINFYEGYSSICVKDHRRINHGPFAWSSLMKKDRALNMMWSHICKKQEEKNSNNFIFGGGTNEVNQENTSLVTSESNESEVKFKKKTLESYGYNDIVPYDVLKKKLKKELNSVTLPLGLTLYEEQANVELQLVDRIHQLLPKQKVIWKSLDRFFALLYPFMPFVDEYHFTETISKIIGDRSYEDAKIKEIKVEKRLDLAYLGLLLIILRLSYLSLFCNKESVNEMRLSTDDPSEEAQDLKYLIQNPIGISMIDTAHACLSQFDIFRKASMPVLQLAFYLQLYHVFAPEDGDDGDGADTYALNSMIVQMAYSLGLNREPDNFPDVLNNKRENNLGRKIWHNLILTDIHHSYSFGNPRTICDHYYDTKLPYIEDGAENCKDKTLDNFVVQMFPCYLDAYSTLNGILKMILNVSGKTKMSELCKLLSKYELAIYEKYGTLSDCLSQKNCSFNHIYARNMPVKLYISLKSFLVSVYFHIFLYYEKKHVDLSFFYLKKIIQIAATDIMPHYFELLGNSEAVCDMIINPKLIQIIHKLNQINLALILRVNFTIYHLKNQENHSFKCSSDETYYAYYKELCKFSSCLTRCAEVGVAAVSKLSTRYYYAWKVTKGNNYLLKIITTMDFYEKEAANGEKIMLQEYKIEQIQELGLMAEVALSKLGKTQMMGDEFCSTCNYKNYKSDMSTTSSESNPTPTTTTSIPDTRKYTDEFGLDFVNNEDIDKIWLQMITMKNDQQQQNEPNTPGFTYNTPYGGVNNYIDPELFDTNSFDILVDFDRLLNADR